MHRAISYANNGWEKPKKNLIITNMYYITQKMQLQYKMSLHDVQITTQKKPCNQLQLVPRKAF